MLCFQLRRTERNEMEDDYEDVIACFYGPCTCEHEQEEHGWDGCSVDGCECEAHWEE